jgi:hypothetical protein
VRCTRAAHDDGEDVDFGSWLVLADDIGEGVVFGANQFSCVGEVVVRAVLPFPYLNLFLRGVSAATVCVTDVSRFEESDKVGFVCRGSHRGRAGEEQRACFRALKAICSRVVHSKCEFSRQISWKGPAICET